MNNFFKNMTLKSLLVNLLIVFFAVTYLMLVFANESVKHNIFNVVGNPISRFIILLVSVFLVYTLVIVEKKMSFKLLLALFLLTCVMFVLFDMKSTKEIVGYVDRLEDKVTNLFASNTNVQTTKQHEEIIPPHDNNNEYCTF